MRPYSTCAASSSALTSLSRTPAHDASLLGTILIPYFLSKPLTEAITTDAQSVSGMKPIFTSFFSGASDPAAHTLARIVGESPATSAAVPSAECEMKCRREASGEAAGVGVVLSFIGLRSLGSNRQKK